MVGQTGWYGKEEGHEVRIEGDSLLRPAKKYLFATRYNPEEGWYDVVAQRFVGVLVGREARRGELEERFEQAEDEQISPDLAPRTPPGCGPGSQLPRAKEEKIRRCAARHTDPVEPVLAAPQRRQISPAPVVDSKGV